MDYVVKNHESNGARIARQWFEDFKNSYLLLGLCNQDEFKSILSFEAVSFGIEEIFL